MKCPFCGNSDTRVIDSRPAEDNNSIRRRRICDECGKRFTTYEKVETIPLIIIKKDKNRETYDRVKLEGGVLRACHKRPITAQQITNLVDEVETEIFSLEEKEIESRVIGEKRYDIMCDDEGLLKDAPKISAINDMGQPMFVGNLMFFKVDEAGELVGLSDEDVEYIMTYIQPMSTLQYPDSYPMLTQCEYD